VKTPKELTDRELLRAWKQAKKEAKARNKFFYYDEEVARLEAEVVERDLDLKK